MHTRTVSTALIALVLAGCPSKEGEQKDAQTSSASSGTTPVGNGPLANLESSAVITEMWTAEGGQQVPMLYYARENVRLSAPCRQGGGQLSCDAIRQVRGGMPIEIPRRTLDGRTSAGIKACRKLNFPIVILKNSVGSEDSMCRFPDGSLVSNGALEQYGIRIIE